MMRGLLRQSVADWDAPLRISGLGPQIFPGAISKLENVRRELHQVADEVLTGIISRE